MLRHALALVILVGLVLYLSHRFLGEQSASLAPAMQEQFRQADADSSGYVDFNEFYFWHRASHSEGRKEASHSAGFDLQQNRGGAALAAALAAPMLPPPRQDNSFMKLSSATAAALVATPPPPPIPPPPPPPPSSTEYTRAKFDNSYMKVGGGVPAPAAAAQQPALGPTYQADPSCHPTLHAGFGGGAFTWGMTFKVESAAACCAACKAHAATCGPGIEGKVYTTRSFKGARTDEKCSKSMGSNEGDQAQLGKCNTWVFCPTPEADGGLCWSNDVWNHTYGECWLKHQLNPARPYAGAYNAYPEQYRKKHRTTPPMVQWMSGVLSEVAPVVDGPHWHW